MIPDGIWSTTGYVGPKDIERMKPVLTEARTAEVLDPDTGIVWKWQPISSERRWTLEGEPTDDKWGPRWALWNFVDRRWDPLPEGYNPHHEKCDCPEHSPTEEPA